MSYACYKYYRSVSDEIPNFHVVFCITVGNYVPILLCPTILQQRPIELLSHANPRDASSKQ